MNPGTLDDLEIRDPQDRERDLMRRLPALLQQAQSASGWARILQGVDAGAIDHRAALAQLPVTRKSQLKELQQHDGPFGGLTSTAPRALSRICMSPGPIFDPQGHSADWWRFARPMYAAGVRAGGLLQNCFSYHFTPAAFMVESGAARIGCTVIPAGSGQTELQVQAMAALRPDTYVGTPSFLKIILEKASETGTDVSSLTHALVSAEALPDSLRKWFAEHGVPHVCQAYASADAGNIAYETRTGGALNPGMVLDEDVILEIVRPGTGDPVAPGEVGEVVLTVFNPDYPLVRFATGDLSALLADAAPSPCGRTNVRIRGWLGRADQTTKVRAMFVHPAQVHDVARRHGVAKARLVVTGTIADETMTLQCEVDDPATAGDGAAIVATLRDVTKLRGEVQFVQRGSLPNDGKVIDDRRDYT
ncbi:phenylacetate--CoA ligase family protein [Pseudoduganella umbonata]|uniref:Phenylacetate--CoA ligase n=1 Tax=Pseudoduganella umbonata TaxID=864828 RepID=A0A4P8HS34_9BURK|nr:AMP-binding protein [Pseudoduganella umbonata]MBB3223913.1 phenylacetate-CoA ligase [Pseudoduganella umbonata]QCP12679.1 phenylacetate--CoA ligase [Pseudoduganella umbonata]